MEHFYKTRKQVVCVLFIIALCLLAWVTDARAQHVDLKGGDVMEPPQGCSFNKMAYVCVRVEKDGKQYMVMLDKKGEAHIFSLVGNVGTLIWSRSSV